MPSELVSQFGRVRVIREWKLGHGWRYVREWLDDAGRVQRFEVLRGAA